MEKEGKLDLLQEMYQQWPFFGVTLDMVEMVFAKSDPSVHQFYERGLVDESLWGFGAELRGKFEKTKAALLRVGVAAQIWGPGSRVQGPGSRLGVEIRGASGLQKPGLWGGAAGQVREDLGCSPAGGCGCTSLGSRVQGLGLRSEPVVLWGNTIPWGLWGRAAGQVREDQGCPPAGGCGC